MPQLKNKKAIARGVPISNKGPEAIDARNKALDRVYRETRARAALGEVKGALMKIRDSVPKGINPRRLEFDRKLRAVDEMLRQEEGSAWTPEAIGVLKEYVGFQNGKWLRRDKHKIAALRAFIRSEGAAAERAGKKQNEVKQKGAEVRPNAISAKDAHEAAKKSLIEIRRQLMIQNGAAPLNNIRALSQTIKSGELNGISASFLRLHIARLAKENPRNPEIAALQEFLRVAGHTDEPRQGTPANGRDYVAGILEKAEKGTVRPSIKKEFGDAKNGIWGVHAKNLINMRVRELERSAPKSHELAELKRLTKSAEFRGKKETQPAQGGKGGFFGSIGKGFMSFISFGRKAGPLPGEITGALKRRSVEVPANGKIGKDARKAVRDEYKFMQELIANETNAERIKTLQNKMKILKQYR